jgi:hypothetical protein
MPHNLNNTLKEFKLATGGRQVLFAAQLGKALGVKIERLPVSIRWCWNRCCATATARRSPKNTSASWPTGSPSRARG